MSSKNDKWVMFRNYMANELGITKEDVREWINDAVKEEAKKIVNESFSRENPEQFIRRAIYDHDYFRGKAFNSTVIRETAEILAEKLEINIKDE